MQSSRSGAGGRSANGCRGEKNSESGCGMRLRSLHPSRRSPTTMRLLQAHRGPGPQMPKLLPRRSGPHISDMCGLLPLARFRCAAHGRFGLGVAPAVARSGGTRGVSSHCPAVLLRKVSLLAWLMNHAARLIALSSSCIMSPALMGGYSPRASSVANFPSGRRSCAQQIRRTSGLRVSTNTHFH